MYKEFFMYFKNQIIYLVKFKYEFRVKEIRLNGVVIFIK